MMRRSDADEGAAGVGIKMGRAFAHQVGCPKQAFGTRGHGGRFFAQKFVGIAVWRESCVFREAKGVAEPAQREARGLGYAHDMPAAGNGVAERMQAAAWIEGRAV